MLRTTRPKFVRVEALASMKCRPMALSSGCWFGPSAPLSAPTDIALTAWQTPNYRFRVDPVRPDRQVRTGFTAKMNKRLAGFHPRITFSSGSGSIDHLLSPPRHQESQIRGPLDMSNLVNETAVVVIRVSCFIGRQTRAASLRGELKVCIPRCKRTKSVTKLDNHGH